MFDIDKDDPAMEPAVHIPANPIIISTLKTRAMDPAFLVLFVCSDLPRKYDTNENVITENDAIIKPDHNKKADWHAFNFGALGKITVELTCGGSSQSINS